ncbi:MAG: hypothetical protein JNK82_10530, partial [Myxococcaceae bacterium]|nr:hypothetical protein [Myxococcaceae bacterium]
MRIAAVALALLVACGKPPGPGGLEVDITYALRGGTSGCVLLKAAPAEGTARERSKSLDGLARTDTLTFGVAQAPDWPSPQVTLTASLFSASCGGLPVATDALTRNFPSNAVERVTFTLTEPAAGGAGGGTAGGGGST